LGGLFAPRPRPAPRQSADDDDIIDVQEVEAPTGGRASTAADQVDDDFGDDAAGDLEGPRQFGPAGKRSAKKRRVRPAPGLSDPDDLE
jgi:hypothetical protein